MTIFRHFSFITLIAIYNYSFADLAPQELLMLQNRLEISSLNWANKKTTRTPEGGPYKKRKLTSGKSGIGKIIETEDFLMKYEPGHPDADKSGYVKYPNINESVEMTNASMAAFELIAKAQNSSGDLVYAGTSNLGFHVVEYLNGKSDILKDTFNISDGQLKIWQRELRTGEINVIKFF